METRLISPKELGKLLGVSDHTAAAHMRKHPRCINLGLGGKQYLRLPIDAVEDIMSGGYGITEEPTFKKPARPRKTAKTVSTKYVPYR